MAKLQEHLQLKKRKRKSFDPDLAAMVEFEKMARTFHYDSAKKLIEILLNVLAARPDRVEIITKLLEPDKK